MATPYRCTVTIDSTKFDAVSTSVKFATQKDNAGMAQMGSLGSEIRVWADFHDDQNLPFSALKKFFDMANVVTRDKIKDIKIEYWKDDAKQDALLSYGFKGWISRFETANPTNSTRELDLGDDASGKDFAGLAPSLNHMLVLDLEPVLNQEHFTDVKVGN